MGTFPRTSAKTENMDWEITRPDRVCGGCEKELAEEEDLFSALKDEQTEFVRRNYCLGCWQAQDPDEFFSFWRTQIPKRDAPPKRFVDDDVLLNFFTRLEGEEEPVKVNFRYVLALLLIRKKLLKFKSIRRDDDKEWLILHDRTEDRDQEVLNPELTEEQISAVTEECGKLLNMKL